ncbi:MAG: CHAP domain-containing protein [Bacteroidales bacterium]|nr:CHAP domain-containing protein [Bacteroidales bacterium]
MAWRSTTRWTVDVGGHAKDWGATAQALGYAVNNSPAVGSVAWSNAGYYGHVAWVSAVSGNQVTIEEYNYNGNGRFNSRTVASSNFTGFIHISDPEPEVDFSPVKGQEMKSGNVQTIPDGDYIIVSSLNQLYYLDISGTDVQAKQAENVQFGVLFQTSLLHVMCGI